MTQLPDSRHLELWDRLDRIRAAIGTEEETFADLLQLTPKRYRALRTQRKSPPVVSISALADEVHISIERLFRGDIDFTALQINRNKDAAYVPERYSKGAHSRRRTSVDVLRYLELFSGWRTVNSVLQHFQIREAIFQDPDAFISLQFLTDLCDYLGRLGYSDQFLIEMGKFTVAVNSKSMMGRTLARCTSPREVYDLQVNQLMGHYDHNYFYRTSRLTDETCEIEVLENKDVAQELGVRHLGSPRTCATRLGRALAVPGFIGLPHSNIVETHCIHRGDPVCRLRVDYSRAAASARGH